MKNQKSKYANLLLGIIAVLVAIQFTWVVCDFKRQADLLEFEDELASVVHTTDVVINPYRTEEKNRQQELWLSALEWCESRGYDNAINPDDGGSRSVGIFQFKDSTFQHYVKVYELNFEPEDIYNREKQTILAKLMLQDGLEYHWKNCSDWIGEPYPAGR